MLPNWKKSDMKIYHNAQICYERGDMEKDKKTSAQNILEDSEKTSQKSSTVWSRSEKHT